MQSGQILTNVVMFVPIGLIVGRLWKWRGMLYAVALSCVIEVLQLITARGLCEFDDVIHNSLGAAMGIGIALLVKKLRKREW